MSNLQIAVQIVEDNSELSIKKIKAHLDLADVPAKIQKEALDAAKAEGLIEDKPRAGGVADRFYDYLVEDHRTQENALGWLKAEAEESGSANILRNEKHYLKIAATVEKMWMKVEEAGAIAEAA